jgi:CelD/BcsL family acetyltransferase involved in cellulose biosynthesis
MRVDIVHPSELGPAEITSWHSMQQATPSLEHPFLSPEFAIAVGRLRPESRVAVLTDGQVAIGFLPFEKRRFGIGVPISGWLSACQGVVHAPDAQWDPRELVRKSGLAVFQYDNLMADQTPFDPYHSTIDPAPAIDLSEGFDAYYAKLRARAHRFCRELERKTRKLDREVGELRFVRECSDPGVLRTLAAWKSEQYRRTDHVDRFDKPWTGELLETLLTMRADHLSGVLSVMYAGDQPVSIQFGLRAGSLVVGWFTGYDFQFNKYSPGLIMIRMMTEELAEIGVDRLHMGKGAKRYTEELKNSDVFVGAGTVTSRSALGTAHHMRNTTSQWALRTVREHRGLHDAADRLLRRAGVSSRMYGRV